jgi:hypothetical protein
MWSIRSYTFTSQCTHHVKAVDYHSSSSVPDSRIDSAKMKPFYYGVSPRAARLGETAALVADLNLFRRVRRSHGADSIPNGYHNHRAAAPNQTDASVHGPAPRPRGPAPSRRSGPGAPPGLNGRISRPYHHPPLPFQTSRFSSKLSTTSSSSPPPTDSDRPSPSLLLLPQIEILLVPA